MSLPTTIPSDSTRLVAHNQPVNRYHFHGQLRLTHAMHIGSGRGNETTDALVATDAQGCPIIPGSSLRGAFRFFIERMLAGLNEAKITNLWTCQLYETRLKAGQVCIGNTSLKGGPGDLAYRQLIKLQEEGETEQVWQELYSKMCDSCRVFGAGTFWASKIRFTDLSLVQGGQVQIRHGVGIHRDTGTAAPKIKYDRQVVEAGSVFAFEAVGENLQTNDLALLSIGFSQMMAGELPLGGGTGRGLGGCILEEAQVEWVSLNDRGELVNYLTRHVYPHQEQLSQLAERSMNNTFSG